MSTFNTPTSSVPAGKVTVQFGGSSLTYEIAAGETVESLLKKGGVVNKLGASTLLLLNGKAVPASEAPSTPVAANDTVQVAPQSGSQG